MKSVQVPIVGVVLLVLVGCETGSTGEAKRVEFQYRSSEIMVPSADEAIVQGAEVTLELSEYDDGQPSSDGPFRVESAESSNPEVLRVVELKGDQDPPLVRVKAQSRGRARLQVQTTAGPDRLSFRVGRIGRVDVSYWLAPTDASKVDADGVALLQDGTGRFRMTKFDAQGQRLIGGGVEQYLEVTPSGDGRVDVKDPASGSFDLTAEGSGPIEVRGRPSEQSVEYDVVGVDQVGALNLYLPSEATKGEGAADQVRPQMVAPHVADLHAKWPLTRGLPARRGGVLLAAATSNDGRRVVGLAGQLSAESQTSKTCSVRLPGMEGGRWVGDGVVLVVGKQPGVCRVRASLGDAEATYQFVIVEEQ